MAVVLTEQDEKIKQKLLALLNKATVKVVSIENFSNGENYGYVVVKLFVGSADTTEVNNHHG